MSELDKGDTLWLRCACGLEHLSVYADPDDQGRRMELAMWYNGKWSPGWRERLRRAWAALHGEDLWHDQIVLHSRQAHALADWIIEHTEKEDSP